MIPLNSKTQESPHFCKFCQSIQNRLYHKSIRVAISMLCFADGYFVEKKEEDNSDTKELRFFTFYDIII